MIGGAGAEPGQSVFRAGAFATPQPIEMAHGPLTTYLLGELHTKHNMRELFSYQST